MQCGMHCAAAPLHGPHTQPFTPQAHPPQVLRGEMFFYAHVPADIADIFPTLISSSEYTRTLTLALARTTLTLTLTLNPHPHPHRHAHPHPHCQPSR